MSIFVVDILQNFLGTSRKHNEGKGQISFDCPACAIDKGKANGDGKGNLEVNYNRGIYRCWSCSHTNNMHGFIPNLIKRFGNKALLEEYLILKPEYKPNTEASIIVNKLPDGYVKLTNIDKNTPKYNEVNKYLLKRRIGSEIIDEFNIGYTTIGEFHDRIIIPSYDEFGEINYFIARAFEKWVKPKYFNPEAEKEIIIFNENKINWDSTIYLVEGAFDHIVIPNSIPLLGKYVHDKLFDLLYQRASANIVIVLDNDAYDDAIALYKKLDVGDLRGRIKICIPANGLDPSLIFEKMGRYGIIKLLNSAIRLKESHIY
jgi:DNA primase